jgi:hypothetical protein
MLACLLACLLAMDIFESGHLGYQRELFSMVTIKKKNAIFFPKRFMTKF